ncbi:CshA/CshB family fibrillar adhesin-related protein [Schaalia sp. Marseille-Q2122]|uniref:CshA/CshB family fibrillar adhesin-related protein n=1 Tax=Schaalia sp. Marseille-Q2122 TaxID=2736604 RepID=UPI0015882D9C|nr:CshA/CshB family fibrillar adhesin-related protein [Schaalia sp. Marseille-Q2122]
MKHGKRDSRLDLSLRARAHQPRRSILRSSLAAFLALSTLAALNSSFAIDIALERDSEQAQSAQSDAYRGALEGDDAHEPGIRGHNPRDQEPGGTSDDQQVPSWEDGAGTGSIDGGNEGASSPDVSGAPVGDASEATEDGSAAETAVPQKDEGSEVAGEKKPEKSPTGYSGFFRARQPSGTSTVPRDPSILPAVFAAGGSGSYKEWIQWLQWGNYDDDFAGTSRPDVPVLHYGRSRTMRNYRDFGTSGYLLTQCTLSDLTYHSARSGVPDAQARGPLVATVPGAWAGDVLDNLYNSGKGGQWSSGGEVRASWETYPEHYTNLNKMVIGLANGYAYNGNGSIAGQKYTASGFSSEVSFNIQCSAELVEPSGQKRNIPLNGLVFADAEASSAYDGGDRDEWIQAYAWNPGTKWRVLDTLRSDGCPTFARGSYLDADINSTQLLRLIPSGKECVYQNQGRYRTPSGVGGPGAVMFMEGANGATIRMQGSGYSAVALGMVIASDFGDAPSSYGIAGSLFQPKWSAGQPANNSTHEAHMGANLMETRPATVIPGPTRLGQLIDADSHYSASVGADQDDQSGQQPSDEDALNAEALRTKGINVNLGGTHAVSVPCQGPGKVAGWIDWDRNGVFDDTAERSNVATCSGSEVELQWTVPMKAKRSVAGEPGSANTFMRLRIANATRDAELKPTGVTVAGEVEDYELKVYVPTVTLEKTVSAPWTSNPLPADRWTLKLTHQRLTGDGYALTGSGRTVETPVVAGTFNLTESSTAREAVAYQAGQWVCSEAPGTIKPPGHSYSSSLVASGRLSVAQADRVLCRITNTTKPASLAWQKTNKATGDHLGGSSWTLRGPSHPSGVTVEDCMSGACGGLDKDNRPGFFKVTPLKWGDYTVQELAAPAGFRKDGRMHHFPHMVNGIIDVALPAPIPNAPNDTPIIWRKVDASGQGRTLSGAQWRLERQGGATIAIPDCVATNQQACTGIDKDHRGGYFRILTTEAGRYTLTETVAPIGYHRNTQPLVRNISAQELGSQIDLGAIANTAITPPALPFTGGASADAFLFVGGGALGSAAIAAAYRRRQQSVL